MLKPDIFNDNPILKDRIITYLSVHGFIFLDIELATRIVCLYKKTIYRYCNKTKKLRQLFNQDSHKIYNKEFS